MDREFKEYKKKEISNQDELDEKKIKDIDNLKKRLDSFKKQILKNFKFTKAIGLLPIKSFRIFEEEEVPPEFQEEVKKTKPLHLIMIIPEEEYKNLSKIRTEVIKIIKNMNEKLWVHIKTEVDLWNYGLDSKFQFIDAISASHPLYDSGFLGALRVANIHKSLVLSKFDRYIASYCIGGSLVRGTASEESDVDVFIVIDDTDVKRMSRVELLERLRSIIYDYIREAIALAGVKNKLEPQVYLLTDFWHGVKDASPVFFTFIRDGIPFYDRGTFLPWKRLLKMGKIKPSPEAIEQYIKEGDRTEDFVKRRLIDTMIDIYWGFITPTQALMMLAGHSPEAPKVLANQVKEVLVKKEKVMNLNDLKKLEKAIKYYKNYEYGKLKDITGKEIDDLRKDGEEYRARLKEIREKLELTMQRGEVDRLHGEIESLLKNIFGNKSQEILIKSLENELIKKGKLPPRMLDITKEVLRIKRKVRNKKLTQTELQRLNSDANILINSLVEYLQRKELVSVEKGIFQLFYKNNKGEIIITDQGLFLIIENGIKKIKDGKIVDSDKEELGTALENTSEKLQSKISMSDLEIIKKEIGNFEIIY